MQLMLVQTGEIIWSGKVPFRSNNPITRDELLSRFSRSFIPSRRLIVGLVAGVFS